ncbi:unnamed protein product [Ectocarpus sp. 13 AM-2016]
MRPLVQTIYGGGGGDMCGVRGSHWMVRARWFRTSSGMFWRHELYTPCCGF